MKGYSMKHSNNKILKLQKMTCMKIMASVRMY